MSCNALWQFPLVCENKNPISNLHLFLLSESKGPFYENKMSFTQGLHGI